MHEFLSIFNSLFFASFTNDCKIHLEITNSDTLIYKITLFKNDRSYILLKLKFKIIIWLKSGMWLIISGHLKAFNI